MRTFEDINADIKASIEISDADALLRLAEELDGLETLQSKGAAGRAVGWALYCRGNFSQALDHLRRALSIYESIDDCRNIANASGAIGSVLYSLSDYPGALSYHNRALALYEELGDRRGVARTLGNIGNVHAITGDYQACLDHLQRSLKLHEELGNLSGVANLTGNVGNFYNLTGNNDLALEHFRRALAIYEQLGDRSGVAFVTTNMGNAYWSIGDFPAALEHFRRARSISEDIGDRDAAARVIGNIGVVYEGSGDYPLALEHFRRSLELLQDIGNRSGAALAVGNIGDVYFRTGNYPEALEHHYRAMAMHEELGEPRRVAVITCKIGNLYNSTGDYPAALDHYRRALTMYEDLDDHAGSAEVICNIGVVYENTGDYEVALDHYRRALELRGEGGNRGFTSVLHSNIATTLLKLNRHVEASLLLEKQDVAGIDDPTIRAEYHRNRATLSEYEGDLEAAGEHLHRALALVKNIGARAETADYHKALRDLALKQNSLADYVEHNNEYQRITEEVNGRDTATRLAMQAKQREIDAREREHAQHMAVLHSTLPKNIADRVARGETVNDHYEYASVLFLDIVGFTAISDIIPPGHVVHLLSQIFSTLDEVCKGHGVTKIKTIGDSYMAVAGVPDVLEDHAQRAALCAADMLSALNALVISMPPELGDTLWIQDVREIQVRIGLHCGPVTAGVIGTERLQYDVWGDTVNVASRMESTGEPGRIHVSEAFADALRSAPYHNFTLTERGTIDVKGKGAMMTYWLEGA